MTQSESSRDEEPQACRFPSCPGHYEHRRIVHHEPFEGHTVFIDDVPAKVCRVCGDVLFPADTAYALDAWRDRLEAGEAGPPDHTELYHFDRSQFDRTRRRSYAV